MVAGTASRSRARLDARIVRHDDQRPRGPARVRARQRRQRRRRRGTRARPGVPARATPPPPPVGRRDRRSKVAVSRPSRPGGTTTSCAHSTTCARRRRRRRASHRGDRARRVQARRGWPMAARATRSTTSCPWTSASARESRAGGSRFARCASFAGPAVRWRPSRRAPPRHERRHHRRSRQRGELGGPPGRLRQPRLGSGLPVPAVQARAEGVVRQLPGRGACVPATGPDERRTTRARPRRPVSSPTSTASPSGGARSSRAPRTRACCASTERRGRAEARTSPTRASGL